MNDIIIFFLAFLASIGCFYMIGYQQGEKLGNIRRDIDEILRRKEDNDVGD